MDTFDGSLLVALLFGTLVAAVVLYFVIRLAVTHAIVASRPERTDLN